MRGDIQRPGSTPEGPYDYWREKNDATSHSYDRPGKWGGSRWDEDPDPADYADLRDQS